MQEKNIEPLCWHVQNSNGYGIEFVLKGFLEGNVPFKEEYALFPMPVIDNVINYKVCDC